jgi:MFS transporter, PAT family, beta-lactamase induction signal transducer AmpG
VTGRRKLGLLACLYLSQGLPYGFFTKGVPALMRDQGLSLADIGLTSLLFLPWALKFMWAPLVDRYGARRAWIVPLQLLNVGALVGVALLDPKEGFFWILAAVLVVNLLSATQDIATDALAVDLLTPAERGLGNGVQVAGYRLGMIVGGGALLIVLDDLGWTRAFLLMAGLLALATIPIALHREAPRARATTQPGWSQVVEHFRRPGAGLWALVLVLYKGFDALANKMVEPLMIDLHYSLGDIGWILGTWGSVAGLVGALVGGWAVPRLGRRRALLGFGVVQVIAVGGYLLPALGIGGYPGLLAVVVADTFFGSCATAALFTLMMDACRPQHAATDYTLQASVVVIAVGVTSSFSGYLAQHLGYAGHFALTAALSALALLAVAWLTRLVPHVKEAHQ